MNLPGRKQIGEILCEKGYLTQSQLESALMEQEKYENLQIGRILLTLGYVTTEQLKEAISVQKQTVGQEYPPCTKCDTG